MRVPETGVRRLLETAGRALRERFPDHPIWRPDAELSVAFVDAERMRELNRVHRGRDRVTDVLAFDYGMQPRDGAPAAWSGEIVVCTDQAERRAPEFGNEPGTELALYLLHGLLHLLGMTDADDESRRRMREMETRLMKPVCEEMDPGTVFSVETDPPGGRP